MTQYLLSIIQPDGDLPDAAKLDGVMADVGALKQEMQAAGVWVFAAGLYPPSTATVVRMRDGDLLLTDGPFAEGKEHIGGFCIIKAQDLDAALRWAQKFAAATTLPIEVRPIQDAAVV